MIGRRALLAALAAAGLAPAARATARRDLTGVWTFGTYTDLQRPKELPRLVLTEAEALAYEAPRRALHGMTPSKPGEVGQPETEFTERGEGLLRLNGQIRSSLIVDPPDGKIPYTAEARARFGLDLKPEQRKDPLDNPEERPNFERCLISPGTGAPLIPSADTNDYGFVLTREALAIQCEKFHDVRVARIGAAPEANPPPSWLGTSVGRWAGEALIVETTGFRPGITSRGIGVFFSDRTRVVERFERTAPDTLAYGFTVVDETLFTRPWRAELAFRPAPSRVFEYACHEGNYGLPDILRTARRAEAAGRTP
jgi:hypothetical protein